MQRKEQNSPETFEGILFLEDKWYIEYLKYSQKLYFSTKFDIIQVCPTDVADIQEKNDIDFQGKKVKFCVIIIDDKKYAKIIK